MKHINELSNILNKYLNWNKARVMCLAQMIQAIIAVKTINLSQVATGFCTKSKINSSYKRIQRFLRFFEFEQISIIKIITNVFSLSGKIILSIDRTNWTFGKTHINFLVLAIAFKGIAIPIFWKNLARSGGSKTEDRIKIISKILKYITRKKIKYILADREFIGEKWFKWLLEEDIPFIIRIKSNTMVKANKEDELSIPINHFFIRVQNCRRKYIKTPFWIGSNKVFISASRSPKGELLIVASPVFSRSTLMFYKRRWEIETLFGCLKSKGFCLEDTHILNPQRIEKLFFVLTIAFCWAYAAGIQREEYCPIKTKNHGRKMYNLFRYGFELLRKAILNKCKSIKKLLKLFSEITYYGKGAYVC